MFETHVMTTDRRSELADFLRGRRTRATPAAAGLKAGPRRRTPGLRREELAQLAGLSVDWYTRLEQGRDVNPSRETLQAIARVLQLDDDERGHLFYLARPESPHDPSAAARARASYEKAEPAMIRALEAMAVPALVISPRFDLLAWNAAACRLLVPIGDLPRAHRNILWLTFRHPAWRARYADISLVERESVASFRFAASSFVGDPHFDSLIADLLETSEIFRAHWARHEVRAKTGGTKGFRTSGEPLALDWHTLASTTAAGQQLVYYVPRPGDEPRFAELCGG